jgi:electron transfer flavoprotein alpha subunit
VTSTVTVDAEMVALVVVRDGRLPAGASEVAAEASGRVVVAGTGARAAASGFGGAITAWWSESGTGAAGLVSRLAPALTRTRLVILPASPDGRDLAPRLAAVMGRPLLAGAVSCSLVDGLPRADLLRVDGRTVLPAGCAEPAVATLLPGSREPLPAAGSGSPADVLPLHPLEGVEAPDALADGLADGLADAETVALIEPEPATMDLSEARRVVAGGAGLVRPGASPREARAVFALLRDVAAALGASAGATRVVTDAGWMAYERQIGTTGVSVDPDLYIAFGVSGASQHVGGVGSPDLTISVNTDPSCPMTSMADLGLVADAASLVVELARRLAVPLPDGLPDELTAVVPR